MYEKLYDGTSAYKIEEYYNYTEEAAKNQEEKKKSVVKASAINRKKLIVVASVVFAVAIAFLYANVMLIQTATKHEQLTKELEDIKVRNVETSFLLVSDVDLEAVEQKAINEFGMQHPESHQNVYVDVVQSDYVEPAVMSAESESFLDKMIIGLKSFLAYIG